MAYIAELDNVKYRVSVLEIEPNKYQVTIDNKSYIVDAQPSEYSSYSVIVNGKSFEANIERTEDGYNLITEGDLFRVKIMDELKLKMLEKRGGGAAEGKQVIKSEMPGKIVEVKVKPGDKVKEGDLLLILEAMKMQNEIKAPKEGEVKEVFVKNGDTVEAEAKLVVVE